jgi:hypothetical protein
MASVLAAGLLMLCLPLSAQTQQAGEFVDDGPLYRGTSLKLDIAGWATNFLGSDYNSTEVAASVNLKNRFFPTIEVGYGTFDTTNDENDIRFKTSAPYFRVGCDYNMMWKKPYLPGFVTLGLRYGFTSMSYDIDAPVMSDPNWSVDPTPLTYEGLSGSASWLEVVLGVECRVYKRFHMGWSLRYRSRLSFPSTENVEPHYVPGFGKNKKTYVGICYNLIYDLPF